MKLLEERSEKKIYIKKLDDVYFVEIAYTHFDLKTSSEVEENCIALLMEEQVEKLCIDFEKVNYITTSGIGALLSIYHFCDKKNVHLSFINVHPDINDVLETTMVANFLNIIN